MDPVSTGFAKTGVSAGVKPTLEFVRTQWARRGAACADLSTLGTADREMDEALSVLKGDADKLPQTIWVKLKGLFSDRPVSFATEHASHFIADDRIIALVKITTRKTFADEDISAECQEARRIYAELYDDEAPFGERLLEDAVAFTFATLAAHLTSGDRILLDVLSGQHNEVMGGVSAILEELGDVKAAIAGSDRAKTELSSANMESQVDTAAIDAAILSEIQRLKRRRFIQDDQLLSDTKSFADRLKAGLRFGTAAIRAEGFRQIAIIYARDELVDETINALAEAEDLCEIDLTPERARILILEKNYDEALKLLRDRTDAASISLFVQAIFHRDGATEAISYFSKHCRAEQLTGHGLHWLAIQISKMGEIEQAQALLSLATECQIQENPLVYFERGKLHMAMAMAPDVAANFLATNDSLPHPNDYHNDQAGQSHLRNALTDFESLAGQATELGADNLITALEVQSLSIRLSLQDDAVRSEAEAELTLRLADSKQIVDLAPLALIHELEFDWSGLRERLAHAERFGGLDTPHLFAAFQLTLKHDSPEQVSAFISKHEKKLEAFVTPKGILSLKIQALAKSNAISEARQLLDDNRADLGEGAYNSLSATVDEFCGENSVATRLTQLKDSDKTQDLELLVDALSKAKDARLGTYLALLWDRKRQLTVAAQACDAFMWNGQTEALDEFLDKLVDHIPQHDHLGIHEAWKFQRQGELSKASVVLDRLHAEGADNHNIRQLRVSILLELGRWSELEPFLQSELSAKDSRSSTALMSAAQLATALESPSALPLIRASLDKGDESPQLFLAAYNAALNLGVERNAEVNGWLKAAIDGSKENGPVYTKDIDDAVELMREGQERNEKLNALIMAAELPLSLAAKPLNVTLSAIYLGQAWENRKNADPRKHNLIPAYAGNRLFWKLPKDPVISFDVTSLLTLQSIGMLGKVLSAFDKVVLPAGTMSQIFQDYSEARHTQPSRVQQAQEIKRLIAAHTLTIEKCQPANEELESEVGAEFARLYQAAMKTDGYVIDTAPLHPPGKLKEIVDPSRFADRLISPKGLISKLKVDGVLSDTVADEALVAVFGSGEEWPSESSFAVGKPLYFSMIAAHYLADAGILPRLKSVFGELVILPDVEELANREIEDSTRASAVRDQIEKLRASVAAGIEDGSIRTGKLTSEGNTDSKDGDTGREIGPLFNALHNISGADIFVCDDRALNKSGTFIDKAENSVNTAISLDVLRHLEVTGAISDNEYQAAIEKIYESGFALVPVDFQQLIKAVCASNWNVGPNATLRQIRNSIHLPLIRGLIKLPEERHWFRTSVLSIAIAIRHVWTKIADVDHAMRAATYLYDMLPDVRVWSAKDNSTDRDVWTQEVTRSSVYMFGSAFSLPESHIEKYQNWFDNYVGPKEEKRDPGVMEAVAKALFESLSKPVSLNELEADE